MGLPVLYSCLALLACPQQHLSTSQFIAKEMSGKEQITCLAIEVNPCLTDFNSTTNYDTNA
jgi:hypothetical protein